MMPADQILFLSDYATLSRPTEIYNDQHHCWFNHIIGFTTFVSNFDNLQCSLLLSKFLYTFGLVGRKISIMSIDSESKRKFKNLYMENNWIILLVLEFSPNNEKFFILQLSAEEFSSYFLIQSIFHLSN